MQKEPDLGVWAKTISRHLSAQNYPVNWYDFVHRISFSYKKNHIKTSSYLKVFDLWPSCQSRAAVIVSQCALLPVHQRKSRRHLWIKALSLSLIITSALDARSLWETTWRWGACVVLSGQGWEGVFRHWWRCWKARWILIRAANTNSSSFNTDGPEASPTVIHSSWAKKKALKHTDEP